MNVNDLINNTPRKEGTIQLTWEQYYQNILNLADVIKNTKKKLDGVYGFPRGGLIVAVCFSHLLNIPLVIDATKITLNTLIVDDIVETGKTFKSLKLEEPIENYITISLIKYKESPFIPTYWVWLTDRWVIFPYEVEQVKK